jgi:hypothetical protein
VLLAELQRQMARALLTGETGPLLDRIAAGPIPAVAALDVHRGTVFGGLAKALRLTFPTVDRLVGCDFFDQAAAAYTLANPPGEACLDAYASAFPAFLEAYAPAAELAYLADAARFDLAVQVAGAAAMECASIVVPLDQATRLTLSSSLRIERFIWPVDHLRDALDAGEEDRLAAIDMTAGPRAFALWRGEAGAMVKPLSPPSAAFLSALLSGAGADQALNDALNVDPSEALARIQAEVFSAGFATIHIEQTGGDRP